MLTAASHDGSASAGGLEIVVSSQHTTAPGGPLESFLFKQYGYYWATGNTITLTNPHGGTAAQVTVVRAKSSGFGINAQGPEGLPIGLRAFAGSAIDRGLGYNQVLVPDRRIAISAGSSTLISTYYYPKIQNVIINNLIGHSPGATGTGGSCTLSFGADTGAVNTSLAMPVQGMVVQEPGILVYQLSKIYTTWNGSTATDQDGNTIPDPPDHVTHVNGIYGVTVEPSSTSGSGTGLQVQFANATIAGFVQYNRNNSGQPTAVGVADIDGTGATRNLQIIDGGSGYENGELVTFLASSFVAGGATAFTDPVTQWSFGFSPPRFYVHTSKGGTVTNISYTAGSESPGSGYEGYDQYQVGTAGSSPSIAKSAHSSAQIAVVQVSANNGAGQVGKNFIDWESH